MPAVEDAPARPLKLEPSMSKLPLLLTEPVAVINTPPVPVLFLSPCNVKFAPDEDVSAPVI